MPTATICKIFVNRSNRTMLGFCYNRIDLDLLEIIFVTLLPRPAVRFRKSITLYFPFMSPANHPVAGSEKVVALLGYLDRP